jgi:preprotein translocase subunit YajC
MLMFTLAFAQEASQAPQAQQSPLMGLAPVALIFIVFYFLLIRPQKKQQQEHVKMLSELKKNDEVVTSGGIHGTIVNMQDDVVVLRVDENSRIKIQKSAVARVKKKSE